MSTDDSVQTPTSPKLSRRSFFRIAGQLGLGAVGASVLAACGQASSTNTGAPAASNNQPVTISMMGWGSILEKDNVQAGLNLFQERNPDIKVNWIHTPEDYETKLKTMLAGGTPPDIFWAGNLADYVSRGVVMDITDRVKSDPVIGKPDYFIQPQEEQRATINGKWYGIGSCWVMHHIYYNVEAFEKAGIEPPSTDPAKAWTWEQFLDISRQLTLDSAGKHPGESGFDENNISQWGTVWGTWHLPRTSAVYSNGGDAYTSDYKIRLGEDSAVEAMQRVADLSLVHKVAPQAAIMEQMGLSPNQMLASGRLAMAIDGSWALQDIAKMEFRYGCGVLPKMKEAATDAQAHMHMIHKDTKNPDAAWKLLAFLASDDYQLGLVKVGLWLPSHTSLLTESGIKSWLTPGVHPEGFELLASSYLRNHAHNYFYPAGFGEANTIINSALDPAWIGESSVAEALASSDAIAKAEAILQKSRESLS